MIQQTTKEIQGYQNSEIAKTEKEDCVVRAIAAACNVDYDDAHTFVAETFERSPKSGVTNFENKMKKLIETGFELGGKVFQVRGCDKRELTNTYKLYGELIDRKKTVKSFMVSHLKGNYIISVARHAFALRDGELYDNKGEEWRPTRKVLDAFQITEGGEVKKAELTRKEMIEKVKKEGIKTEKPPHMMKTEDLKKLVG